MDVELAAPRIAHQARDVVRQLLHQRQHAAQVTPAALHQHLGAVLRAHDLAQQRQRFCGHVEIRVQAAAQAFEGDEGLDQQRQVAGQSQVVRAQDGGHVSQHAAQTELRQRHTVVLVDKGFDFGLERIDVGATAVAGPVEQHIGHRLRVALHQAQQQGQQFPAALDREAAHHAEVDEGDAVVRQIEDVAGVRVGVEQAVFHNHLEHGLGAALRQQLAVIAALFELFQMVARDTRDEVLHIHAFAGVVPVHPGNHDPGHPGHVFGDALGVAAFAGQIEFALQ